MDVALCQYSFISRNKRWSGELARGLQFADRLYTLVRSCGFPPGPSVTPSCPQIARRLIRLQGPQCTSPPFLHVPLSLTVMQERVTHRGRPGGHGGQWDRRGLPELSLAAQHQTLRTLGAADAETRLRAARRALACLWDAPSLCEVSIPGFRSPTQHSALGPCSPFCVGTAGDLHLPRPGPPRRKQPGPRCHTAAPKQADGGSGAQRARGPCGQPPDSDRPWGACVLMKRTS